MSNNDKSKTSKTARVMNLLSKKPASAPASEEASGEAPVSAEVKPAAQTPPILSSIGADAAASNQIKSALEDALEAELAPAPQPEPAQPPVSVRSEAVQSSTPVQPAPAQPEPVSFQPEPVQEPVFVREAAPVQESAPVQQPVQTAAQPSVRLTPVQAAAEHLGYINVMQVLVEEKAPKYIKMFGLCDCSRCLEDVKALTLNHLPPKYVVLAENEMIPKLTFYEGKYNSDITVQLLKACSMVAERPHHKRD